MLARRVAAGVAAQAGRPGGARRLSAAAPAGNWVISPAASTLLASNPGVDVKALATKCALQSPGSGKVVITKV
jgi:DNA-binding transcriptional LysR family regulator